MPAHNNDMLGSATSGAQFGIINSMRTGVLMFDMAMALTIPLVFQFLFGGGLAALAERITSWFTSRKSGARACIRSISHQTINGRVWQCDQKNEMLQKALTLYLTQVLKVVFRGKASVALTAMHDMRFWNNSQGDRFNPLQSYRLTWLAPDDEWVAIAPGVEFRQFREDNSGGDNGGGSNGNNNNNNIDKEVSTFQLRSFEADGHAKVDALIAQAVDWYKEELLKMRDDSRYLYTMIPASVFSLSSDSDKDSDKAKYKRYRLSDQKTFGSLFFPEKDALLSLLDDFGATRGKFAIPGFPHKLGLLLHGPPGTGKTSLIKALAHATNRSIISIPLAQLKTNHELMTLMYDLNMKVEGLESKPSLDYKNVIFVMEDVDAAADVVLRRDGGGGGGVNGAMAGDPHRSPPTPMTALATLFASQHAEDSSAVGPKPPSPLEQLELLKPRPDALSLAGLLNVLDGVVDTPGRILVMTSNHPERLDPALVRPGRIDRQIYLGWIQPDEAKAMIAHYFQDAALERSQPLDAALAPLRDAQVTPAMLESLCARADSVDDLLALVAKEAWFPAATADDESGSTLGAGPWCEPVKVSRAASREKAAG